MPKTSLVFYKDDNGAAPVVEWLDSIREQNNPGFKRISATIKELELQGHELRRPVADALRDGIRELRIKHQRVQYRVLYFFNGKEFAVLAHAIIKKDSSVPEIDIERAIKRKLKFEANTSKHTWKENYDYGTY